ncbi:MAG: arcadin 1 [Candidatus Bathyarchaeota archaeon]|nr:MAG: arcadin 1 [Candidatus Bathyarchaeota archaeon]
MVLVRVQRIESIRDPEGTLGKRIELVEERKIPQFTIQPATEEARIVQNVVQTLQQQLPLRSVKAGLNFPKIILFLTEQEYDELGIVFDVNQVYEIKLSNQTIKFSKTH